MQQALGSQRKPASAGLGEGRWGRPGQAAEHECGTQSVGEPGCQIAWRQVIHPGCAEGWHCPQAALKEALAPRAVQSGPGGGERVTRLRRGLAFWGHLYSSSGIPPVVCLALATQVFLCFSHMPHTFLPQGPLHFLLLSERLFSSIWAY